MNCGNRLQNWALQEVLAAMGHDVETLRRDAGINGSLRSKMRALKSRVGAIRHLRDRYGAFRRFDRRVRFSRCVVSKEYVSPETEGSYDAFVVGSDQVWNPDFDFISELEYLPFIPAVKKLSYAASFGVSEISSNRDRTAELLRGFSSISVREDAGAAIVRDLAGVTAEVVLDPTMLVGCEAWEGVARKPGVQGLDSPYLLKYVLGDDAHDGDIAKTAGELGLSVVDLTDGFLPVGPAEFVWLIAHARMVCVDSFHGSVFSLLFHRPFVIFERQSADADMSSRFDTLCRIFDMGHHRFCSPEFDYERCLDENWGAFERRLAAERDRSLGWLRCALEGVGGCDA